MYRLMTASGAPPHGRNEVTVGPKRRKVRFQRRTLVSQQPRRSPLNDLDRAIYSELRVDINQQVDVVRHDLGLEQDAARFFSHFGNDLLGPPIHAIEQHLAPILRTKDHVVVTRKDKVAIRFRSALHPRIYSK
jgi:hypothetical protein